MTIYIRCRRTATAALCALALLAACTDHDDPTGGTAQPTPADALSATATLPAAMGQTGSWGTTTRAAGNSLIGPNLEYNTLTLYHPAKDDAAGSSTLKAYAVPTDYITAPATSGSGGSSTSDAKSFSFATAGTTLSSSDLYWQIVEKGYGSETKANFYLTLQQTGEPIIPTAATTTRGWRAATGEVSPATRADGPATMQAPNVLWAKSGEVAKREPLTFSTPMKSRYARFTLIVKPGGGRKELDATKLTATIKALPAADDGVANDATHIKEQAWPTAENGSSTATTYNLIGTTPGATNTKLASCNTTDATGAGADTKFTADTPAAGSIYLAPQEVQKVQGEGSEALVVTYTHGDRKITEEIDLSQLAFSPTTRGCPQGEGGMPATRAGSNDFTEHTAGQHVVLTLTLTVGTEAMPDAGNITVTDFCEVDDLKYEWNVPTDIEKRGYTVNDDGTTWEVFNENGLRNFANEVNRDGGNPALNCTLTANIILPVEGDESNWTPIGKNETSAYQGTFDGDGHIVTGMQINDNSQNNIGFFGCLTNATIKNLTMESGNIIGKENIGTIAGKANGVTIINCKNTGKVIGNDNVGGIVGWGENTTITACINTGIVQSILDENGENGGIIAYIHGTSAITACINIGEVSSNKSSSGGIIGYCDLNSQISITACINTGKVTNQRNTGEIVGKSKVMLLLTTCYWQMNQTTPQKSIGAGSLDESSTCYSIGSNNANELTWYSVMAELNNSIDTWNSEDYDKQCPYHFTLNLADFTEEGLKDPNGIAIGTLPFTLMEKNNTKQQIPIKKNERE